MAVEKSIVVLNGSPRASSRTGHLLGRITKALARHIEAPVRHINLAQSAPALLSSLSREGLTGEGEGLLRQIEAADLLVVGTPVYRASYTGALKHVFDLVDRDALAGKIVLLAATGGTALHGLVGEHQLRPLFGFFRAITVPTVVFATETEIDAVQVSELLEARIDRAAQEAAHLLSAARIAAARPEPAIAVGA